MQSPTVRELFGKIIKYKNTPRWKHKLKKSKLSKLLYPKQMNSFDHLKSGDFDIIVEKGTDKLNLSELLRDLYTKVIILDKAIVQLQKKLDIGGPPDVDNK